MATRVIISLLFWVAAIGCDTPSEEDCRKAVIKIRKLHGNPRSDNLKSEIAKDVSRCTANASKEVVTCVLRRDIKTASDLSKCPGFDKPAKK